MANNAVEDHLEDHIVFYLFQIITGTLSLSSLSMRARCNGEPADKLLIELFCVLFGKVTNFYSK